MTNFQGAITGPDFTFRQSAMDGKALELHRESKNHTPRFRAKSRNRFGSLMVCGLRFCTRHFEVKMGDFSGLFQKLNLGMSSRYVPTIRNYPAPWVIPETW